MFVVGPADNIAASSDDEEDDVDYDPDNDECWKKVGARALTLRTSTTPV